MGGKVQPKAENCRKVRGSAWVHRVGDCPTIKGNSNERKGLVVDSIQPKQANPVGSTQSPAVNRRKVLREGPGPEERG